MLKKRRSVAVVVTSVIVTFALAGMVVAATSFSGQGAVTFDSIKVGAQGVGGVTYFNGSIVNETTGTGGTDNPVTFGDSIRVDGRLWRGDGSGPSANPHPVQIDDNLDVAGDIVFTANNTSLTTWLTAQNDWNSSQSAWDDAQIVWNDTAWATLNDRTQEIGAIVDMFQCLGNYAAIRPYYIESDDYLDCFNTYLAGENFPVGILSTPDVKVAPPRVLENPARSAP